MIASLLKHLPALLTALVVLGASGLGEAVAQKKVPQSRVEVQLSYAPLVKLVAPAVVNIYTRRVVQEVVRSPLFNDPFFKRFFGQGFGFGPAQKQRRQQNSLGSGVIVAADGLIVTNHHVIKGADEITVALSDRREFAATLVLDDEGTDLAVLRIDIDGEKLPYLEFRDSDEVEVGDLVLAIGNPFNVGQTVTSGIVSAKARTGVGVSDFQFFIQTDAPINPGNSGGALIGMDGRLIGVNTAIFSRSGGSHGIGFAIPSTMVRVVVESAKRGLDYVQRPWLGAATQEMNAEIAQSLGLDRPVGAIIRAIYPGGPADRAGLQVGDVILEFDGHPIDDPDTLVFRLGTRVIGRGVDVFYWRGGSRGKAVLLLVRAPEEPPRDVTDLAGPHPLSGAKIANLSPALAEELGISTLARGVIVLKVKGGSAAQRLRFRPGDRLLQVNGRDIKTVAEAVDAIKSRREEWRITIRRGDQTFNIAVRG